ncbi:histidine triad nucleotide-binding protein 3 [Platysternon megacephalum]|uniref:Histidine triad nucleotide-binding protein 3 n=1 Tax=Platysternon megacephalum TaxID=55544 RepID=A0A4D9E100_9SAUR|nr:histidine triad nucleotide-binding protein 3 [Platysternon megacephalum]
MGLGIAFSGVNSPAANVEVWFTSKLYHHKNNGYLNQGYLVVFSTAVWKAHEKLMKFFLYSGLSEHPVDGSRLIQNVWDTGVKFAGRRRGKGKPRPKVEIVKVAVQFAPIIS